MYIYKKRGVLLVRIDIKIKKNNWNVRNKRELKFSIIIINRNKNDCLDYFSN